MPLILITFEVLNLSAPITFPLKPKNRYVQYSGKYTSLSTFIFPVNDDLFQSKSSPPVSLTMSIHFRRSMFLSPSEFTTLIVMSPSRPTLAFTSPLLFNGKTISRHTAYTTMSSLTMVSSSKSGAVAL